MKIIYFLIPTLFLFVSCSNNETKSDAYGNFEATEITVSSEIAGKILTLTVEEGKEFKTGETVCIIDSSDYILKKEQLIAQRSAILSKLQNINAQCEVYKQQKENLISEKKRFEKLVSENAAPQKQLDDINNNILLTDKQISSVESQKVSVNAESHSIDKQIDIAQLSIKKCKVQNPCNGTVLTKFVNAGELTIAGKSLYRIADLSKMTLKIFISGNQLSQIKLNDEVTVIVYTDEKNFKSYKGNISFISSSSEFTPKIIQTKEEQVNMVYAVKVKVENDGTLKIGMPGEVQFNKAVAK